MSGSRITQLLERLKGGNQCALWEDDATKQQYIVISVADKDNGKSLSELLAIYGNPLHWKAPKAKEQPDDRRNEPTAP